MKEGGQPAALFHFRHPLLLGNTVGEFPCYRTIRAITRSTSVPGADETSDAGTRPLNSSPRIRRYETVAQFAGAGRRASNTSPKGSRQASTECGWIASPGQSKMRFARPGSIG